MSMYLMEQDAEGRRSVLTPPDLRIPLSELLRADADLAFRHGAQRLVLYVDEKPIFTILPGEQWLEVRGVNALYSVERRPEPFEEWIVIETVPGASGGRHVLCHCSNPDDAERVAFAINDWAASEQPSAVGSAPRRFWHAMSDLWRRIAEGALARVRAYEAVLSEKGPIYWSAEEQARLLRAYDHACDFQGCESRETRHARLIKALTEETVSLIRDRAAAGEG